MLNYLNLLTTFYDIKCMIMHGQQILYISKSDKVLHKHIEKNLQSCSIKLTLFNWVTFGLKYKNVNLI